MSVLGFRRRKFGLMCATPDCRDLSGHGSRFCEPCAARLARWKAEMEAATFRTADGRRKRGRGVPTCCSLGCWNPRVAPAAFCDECSDAGYVEETD